MGKETTSSKITEKDGNSKSPKHLVSQSKSPGSKKVTSKKKCIEPSTASFQFQTDVLIKSPTTKKKRKLSASTVASDKEADVNEQGSLSATKEKSYKGSLMKSKEHERKIDQIKTTKKTAKKGRKKKEVKISALPRKSKSQDEDSTSIGSWEENKMATGLAHRSDHSYDEKDDLFFDSDDERGADLMDNSDEDTEDASETDMATLEEEFTEMKEQMYQEKIKDLKSQLEQLKQGVHPEYVKILKLLQSQRDDWIRMSEAFRTYELHEIEKDYEREKKQAKRDLEQKKVELKNTLIQDLLDKKKNIETEKVSLELTGLNTHMLELKTVVTRKLRRRPNDPPSAPEKKRKNNSTQLKFLLNEDQIYADLGKLNKLPKVQCKVSKEPARVPETQSIVTATNSIPDELPAPVQEREIRKHIYEAKIEDGRLFFDKKWYQKGQAIYLDAKEGTRYNALLHSIGSNEIWIKKIQENTRLKIYLSHLHKGKYTIKRRVTGQNSQD